MAHRHNGPACRKPSRPCLSSHHMFEWWQTTCTDVDQSGHITCHRHIYYLPPPVNIVLSTTDTFYASYFVLTYLFVCPAVCCSDGTGHPLLSVISFFRSNFYLLPTVITGVPLNMQYIFPYLPMTISMPGDVGNRLTSFVSHQASRACHLHLVGHNVVTSNYVNILRLIVT